MYSLKNWLLLLFTILFSVTSFSQNGTIKGKVMGDEEPLPSATVLVGQQFLLSNDSGEFLLSLPPGNYRVTVTHAGYKKHEQEVSLLANATITLQINMMKGDEMSGVMVLGSRSSVQRSTLSTPVPV